MKVVNEVKNNEEEKKTKKEREERVTYIQRLTYHEEATIIFIIRMERHRGEARLAVGVVQTVELQKRGRGHFACGAIHYTKLAALRKRDGE